MTWPVQRMAALSILAIRLLVKSISTKTKKYPSLLRELILNTPMVFSLKVKTSSSEHGAKKLDDLTTKLLEDYFKS